MKRDKQVDRAMDALKERERFGRKIRALAGETLDRHEWLGIPGRVATSLTIEALLLEAVYGMIVLGVSEAGRQDIYEKACREATKRIAEDADKDEDGEHTKH